MKVISKDDKSTWEITKALRKHIKKHWGTRCKTYERGCCVCRMWHVYDEFVQESADGLDDTNSYLEAN